MGNIGLVRVPQQQIYVIELLGKYHRNLTPGLNLIIPFVQRVAYKQSLKERSFNLQHQSAVTKDNVSIQVDGVIYFKVVDVYKASYGAIDSVNYTYKLAQSITRSEIGRLSLDQTFASRETINLRILESLQHATLNWGIECTRYEIKDIKVSDRVRKMMALEAESQRFKRAEILKSEAKRTALINEGDAFKASYVLMAQGKAEELSLRARAASDRIKLLTDVMHTSGDEAFSFLMSQNYINSLKNLKGKNLIIENNLDDANGILQRSREIPESLKMSKSKEVVKVSSDSDKPSDSDNPKINRKSLVSRVTKWLKQP